MIGLIQLDAVSPPLVDRLVADGRMPTLAALRERGTHVPLATTEPFLAASAYPTVYSGIEPGAHGMYYGLQWDAAEQRVRHRLDFELPDAVWERVARAGRRSLVVDPYEMRVPSGTFAGVYAAGWQFWNHLGLERAYRPGGTDRNLERRFGPSRRAEEVFGRPEARSLLALRDRLLPSAARVADAVETLLPETRPDLVWATFLGTHLGGHQFLDPSAASGAGPAERAVLDNALAELYEEADRATGRIVAALPEDADVVVLSALGMGPNGSRSDMLGELVAAVLGERRNGRRASVPLWRLRTSVPPRARALAASAIGPRLTAELTARAAVAGVDWSTTRVFVLPSDHHGHLRVNLRGRERDGIVAPADMRPLLEEVAAGLRTFRDEDGAPSVDAVELMDDLVGADAPERARLPDAIVRWPARPSAGVRAVESPVHGRVERFGGGNGRSGGHTDEGWALLVPRGARVREPSRPARLADVAATVSAVLGVDAGDLRGEPLLAR